MMQLGLSIFLREDLNPEEQVEAATHLADLYTLLAPYMPEGMSAEPNSVTVEGLLSVMNSAPAPDPSVEIIRQLMAQSSEDPEGVEGVAI